MFTPRRPGSPWSRSNKERVARLERDGRMTPAGRALVEAAKRDGSWTKLDAVENLEIPPDLAEALASIPEAETHFAAFSASSRRHILAWIAGAKRPETRARRIAETARLAAQNVKANM
ncbi:MAG TPA: YdeI/OmpD-associated family protein [Gaiellaceae bacterium]|nr:YdeI/OmpD-associated family protein [Gaiellaceae bacterium]